MDNINLEKKNKDLKDRLDKKIDAMAELNDRNNSNAQSSNRYQGLFRKAKADIYKLEVAE